MSLILALSLVLTFVMSSVASTQIHTFKLITGSGGVTLSPDQKFFTFDTSSPTEQALPTAQRTGYGFDGWTYTSNVTYSPEAVTKTITADWFEAIPEYRRDETIRLFPVFGRTVVWHFENGDTQNPSFLQFVPAGIDENASEEDDVSFLNEFYLCVYKKDMTNFGPDEITYDGHVFKHWSTSRGGSEDVFDNIYGKYAFGSDSSVTSDTVNLYAVWDAFPAFDPNGGAWGSSSAVKYGTVDPVDSAKYTVDNPSCAYKTFKGWYETKYTGDVPADAIAVTSFEINKTYYAGWESDKYTLSYKNLFTDASNPNPTEYAKAAAAISPIQLEPASMENFVFEGWYKTADNDGSTPESPIEQITAETSSENPFYLYAVWSYKLKNAEVSGIVGSEITPLTLALSDDTLSPVSFSLAAGQTLPAGISFENGVISGTPTEAFRGSVTFTIDPSPASSVKVNGATVNFNFTRRSSGGSGTRRYTVRFDTDGAQTVKSQTVKRNGTVSAPQDPEKDGYTFGGWYTDKAFADKYDFSSKVTKNFTLYAKWVEDSSSQDPTPSNPSGRPPFNDISEDDWFFDDVSYVWNKGIMTGISGSAFAPQTLASRAMLVTVLYRMEGSPAVQKGEDFFNDVEPGSYYENAVIWASQNGIVNGVTSTRFAPYENVLREQLAVFLYRYASYKGIAPTGDWETSLSYKDLDKISSYALPGVNYCTLKAFMQGKDGNVFAPDAPSTRAEVASVLRRFTEALN